MYSLYYKHRKSLWNSGIQVVVTIRENHTNNDYGCAYLQRLNTRPAPAWVARETLMQLRAVVDVVFWIAVNFLYWERTAAEYKTQNSDGLHNYMFST